MKPENQQPKRAFINKRDIFIILALLVVAGGALLFILTRNNQTPPTQSSSAASTPVLVAEASIGSAGEQEVLRIDLNENRIVTIDNAALPVQLEVKDGAIRFVNSVCPDHDCEGFGWLRHEGDWAACLPALVSLQIV